VAEAPNRVYLADIRGRDLYLRATWHPESSTIVFSHWDGEVCTASTPVALVDSTKLIDLQIRALSEVANRRIVPPAAAPMPTTAIDRLRRRLRPKLAQVIDASARFMAIGRNDRQQSGSR
jgi:hypothetical protein